jgi:hypothetical protein
VRELAHDGTVRKLADGSREPSPPASSTKAAAGARRCPRVIDHQEAPLTAHDACIAPLMPVGAEVKAARPAVPSPKKQKERHLPLLLF